VSSGLLALSGQHHRHGLLLDSNLLLLYFVGLCDRRLIRSFKRTAAFTDADFRLLVGLMQPFARLVTTPLVLAEVNGLSNALPERLKPRFRATVALDLPRWDEVHVPAITLANGPAYRGLGLTDAGLAHLAEMGPLVLSTDGALVRFILGSDHAADDFGVYQRLHAQR
jgi:hypothetical protein